jgi:uncharacterized protein YjcR
MALRKGAQPGNTNAVTHGRYSAARRGERLEAARKAAERHREWLATLPQMDYGAIVDELRRLRQLKR